MSRWEDVATHEDMRGLSRDIQRIGTTIAIGYATMMVAIVLAALFLFGCATVDPPRPEQPRTQTITVNVPVITPCFTEAERPVLPAPTAINLDTATVDQMAAAIAADNLADELFARAVDNLFLKCLATGAKQ